MVEGSGIGKRHFARRAVAFRARRLISQTGQNRASSTRDAGVSKITKHYRAATIRIARYGDQIINNETPRCHNRLGRSPRSSLTFRPDFRYIRPPKKMALATL